MNLNLPILITYIRYNVSIYLSMFFNFLIFNLLFSITVYSQVTLPIDSSTGKICFEEIIKLDSISLKVIHVNAEAWIRQNFKSDKLTIKLIEKEGFLNSESRFKVYTKGIISKEIHGTIRFSIEITTKENKYRYRFTNFVFEYYKQNRELKYVPTGKQKPLEDNKFTGWEVPWMRYKKETNEKIIKYIASLKEAMVPKIVVDKKVIKKEEW